MSTTIGGMGGCSGAAQAMTSARASRPSVSDMVDKAFSKLDTQDRGYIDESDLQAALTQTSSTDSTSAGDMIKALDSDSDGKVTKQEMSDALQKLSDQLDSHFSGMRMKHAGGHEGTRPPGGPNGAPPPDGADGAGLTKDQLTSMADGVRDTNSTMASNLDKLVSSFDKADTDGDGKVSFSEAHAFKESTKTGDAAASGASSGSTGDNSDSAVMKQVMRLVHHYSTSASMSASSVSVSA